MSVSRGAIVSEQAYALGKMLDHSSWHGSLVRNITPSDIDMTLDNDGNILYCELDSQFSTWDAISVGQRRLYANSIKRGVHCAVLCRHNVKPEDRRPIDTKTDIISYQVMVWYHGHVQDDVDRLMVCPVVVGNNQWQNFVFDWINTKNGPLQVRHKMLEQSTDFFK